MKRESILREKAKESFKQLLRETKEIDVQTGWSKVTLWNSLIEYVPIVSPLPCYGQA